MCAYALPPKTRREEDVIKNVNKVLSKERRPVPLAELFRCFSGLQFAELKEVVCKNPNNFECFEDGELFVKQITKVSICATHCSKNKTCPGTIPFCSGLHICKFYLLSGKCPYGGECAFGHDLTISHNMKILKENYLDGLPIDDLKFLFGQAESRNSVTAPKICKFYNVEGGCRYIQSGKPCPNLHICKHYIFGRCRRGKNCRRSHNILDHSLKDVLEKHGISTRRTQKEIIAELREAVSNAGSDGSSVGKSPIHIDKNSRQVICFFYLRGRCDFNDSCRNFHGDLPYQWLYRQQGDEEWQIVPPSVNQEMELTYSDPGNLVSNMEIGQRVKVVFKTMTGTGGDRQKYDIHRLSTSSSVEFDRQPLTTVWEWYWKDEIGHWKKYGQDNMTVYKSNISSPDLEQAYIANPEGQLAFSTLGHEYVLDFPKMVQRNIEYKTEKDVCRRPTFISKQDFDELKMKLHGGRGSVQSGGVSNSVGMVTAPSHWEISTGADIMDHCQIVPISKTQKEYKEIERLFCESMPTTVSIKSIERIENGDLWYSYVSKKTRMSKKSNTEDIGERRLFHGTTTSYVDALCRQGFDFRLSGQKSGTRYGKGSYFATTSKYSHRYTDTDNKVMFIVKVLSGEYAQGKSQYVRPPSKDESNPCSDLYDSCVDDKNNPQIFVIFDNNGQVYPEYVIKYE